MKRYRKPELPKYLPTMWTSDTDPYFLRAWKEYTGQEYKGRK